MAEGRTTLSSTLLRLQQCSAADRQAVAGIAVGKGTLQADSCPAVDSQGTVAGTAAGIAADTLLFAAAGSLRNLAAMGRDRLGFLPPSSSLLRQQDLRQMRVVVPIASLTIAEPRDRQQARWLLWPSSSRACLFALWLLPAVCGLATAGSQMPGASDHRYHDRAGHIFRRKLGDADTDKHTL